MNQWPPNAQGAGHYVMIDQPGRFHAAVVRALRGEVAPEEALASGGAQRSSAGEAAQAATQEQDLGAAREGVATVAGV